jgi:hypothetical protein
VCYTNSKIFENIYIYILLFSENTVCIQTKEENDYKNVSHQVIFLDKEFTVKEEDFTKLPSKTIVILDDYVFKNTKETKAEFLHVVNYYLRHHNITLILVIHNMYSTGLLNEVLLAPHIIVSYTNLGYYIIKKILNRLGGQKVLEFWQESMRYNYHFCYINCNKNYLINNFEQLFIGKLTTMFASQQKFVIHRDNSPCGLQPNSIQSKQTIVEHDVYDFLVQTYPKNKTIRLIFKIMLKHELINDNLFFVDFPNIHIADFCSFINNKFGNKETTPVIMIKFCKYLTSLKLRFPRISIKNPIAQNMLT